MAEQRGWGLLSRIFHWSVAALIVATFAWGWIMVEMTDLVTKFTMVQTHKSLGFTVFVLAVLRILWRLRVRAPEPPVMARWQVIASQATHLALYVFTLALPVTGWLMASSSPLNDVGAYPTRIPNMVWGLFEMPDPFPKGDKALSETFGEIHEALAYLLLITLALHVGAALKHAIIERDGVLTRMIRG